MGDRVEQAGRPPVTGFSLPHVETTFRLRAEADGHLPLFLGSTLRGAVAHSLRKLVCLPQCHSVDTCLLRERCAYSVCFETPVPSDARRLRGLDRLPHPVLFEPPLSGKDTWLAGDSLSFSLRLFGRAVDYFPYLLAATEKAARLGLGEQRLPFRLEFASSAPDAREVWPGASGQISSPGVLSLAVDFDGADTPVDQIAVIFETPVRLAREGRLEREISFRTLARALLARYSSLLAFHSETSFDVDFRGLLSEAATVETAESQLVLRRLWRFSNRQKTKVPLDGMEGRIVFKGAALSRFAGLLRAGETMHVGKGTVFGLGKYRAFSPPDHSCPAERRTSVVTRH